MAKPMPEDELKEIEAIVGAHPDGIRLADIDAALKSRIPERTLQRWLKSMTERGRLVRDGKRRWARPLVPAYMLRWPTT